MSAMPSRPPGQTSLTSSARPVRPQLGDFTTGPENKVNLIECPLCALDPERERTVFSATDKPNVHFLKEHDADDIGRPMAELLPERVDLDGGDRR